MLVRLSTSKAAVALVAAALLTAPAQPAYGTVAAPPANPFAGAVGYVNPIWSQRAAEAAATGGPLAPAMAVVARQPTAVWLDRIAAITEGLGLRGHLDAALAQQRAAGRPVVVTVVLYDLPNRSCEREVEPGELRIDENGMARYRTEFIDPIARILALPRYRSLRVAAIIEPHALIGLTGNPWHPQACVQARASAAYPDGVGYALSKLDPIRTVHTYLDVGNAGTLGYRSLLAPMAQRLADAAARTPAGLASVDGFVSNTADYVPLTEPFIPPLPQVTATRFYDFSDFPDASTYSAAMYAALVAAGFPTRIGMLIDTSRNGWGGAARPTAPSTSPDPNTNVNQSRLDRRESRGAWCNQLGAGLGALPQADPTPAVQAYLWVKPPGESDGSSSSRAPGALPGALYDRMCDPTYRWPWYSETQHPTNALPDTPTAGQWHPTQFEQLTRNAHPPIT